MALATQASVEEALQRPLTATETRYLDETLARAERKLAARAAGLLDRARKNPEFALSVVDVEAEMVARVYRAGAKGAFSSEAEGDYSYRLNPYVASGYLTVLPEELEDLGVWSSWGTLTPVTDGYAQQRFHDQHPERAFQYDWPAPDLHSRTL